MANFKVGQIVFFNNDSFYMKVIKLYNKLNYGCLGFSHVGIITDVEKDRILIHEAVSRGFIAGWYSNEYINEKISENKISVGETKEKLSNVKNNANKYLGNPYAWLDILSIASCFFLKFKFLKLTGASRLICSEAVSRILYDSSNKKVDFQSEYDKAFDLITPQDIFLSKQVNILKNKKVA